MFRRSGRIAVIYSLTAVAAIALSAATHADNFRYISTLGKNANDCTRSAPCRTMQRGINATPRGGELRILDSGDFGVNATIRRSITIAGNGNTVLLGNPITVSRDNAQVTLRNLVLTGEGATQHGLEITAASVVRVERCAIHGFASSGIWLIGSGAALFVTDTAIHGNSGDGITAAGNSRLMADNVRIEANAVAGMHLTNLQSMLSRSVLSGNGSDGIAISGGRANISATTAASNGGNGVFVTGQATLQTVISRGNTGSGLFTTTGSTTRASNSVFTDNGNNGIDSSGFFLTRKNNISAGNANPDAIPLSQTLDDV